MADDKTKRAAEIEQAVTSANRAKADAAMMENMNQLADGMTKLVDSIGSITERLDALEEAKGKEPPIDTKAKKTGEDPMATLPPDAATDRMAKSDAQARCDSVACAFGQQAPPPMSGEDPLDYRRRLLRPFQVHSKDFAKVDLNKVDPATFDGIEARIYADARVAADAKPEISGEQLYRRTKHMEGGHTIHEYFGNPNAWMAPFGGSRQRATGDWKTGLN